MIICLCRKQNHREVTAVVLDLTGDAGGEGWSAASVFAGVFKLIHINCVWILTWSSFSSHYDF